MIRPTRLAIPTQKVIPRLALSVVALVARAVAETPLRLVTEEIDLLIPAHLDDVVAPARGSAGVRPGAMIGAVGPHPCRGPGPHLVGVLPDMPYHDVGHPRVAALLLVELTTPHLAEPRLLRVILAAGTVLARALRLQPGVGVIGIAIGMMIDAVDQKIRLPEGRGIGR